MRAVYGFIESFSSVFNSPPSVMRNMDLNFRPVNIALEVMLCRSAHFHPSLNAFVLYADKFFQPIHFLLRVFTDSRSQFKIRRLLNLYSWFHYTYYFL